MGHGSLNSAAPAAIVLSVAVLLGAAPLHAQQPATGDAEPGLGNETELSAVATFGNASTTTFGLRNLLTYEWAAARYRFRIEAVRSASADDPYVEATVGASGNAVTSIRLIQPDRTLDVENYLIENVYDRRVLDTLRWQAGLTWDHNEDAGIDSRYVAFTGLGHLWVDGERRHLETSYSLAYVDRRETRPDPEKDARFAAARLAWDFWNQWGGNARVANVATFNVNATDAGDWSVDTTSALTVDINDHLALRSSLQWLYNNRPALRSIDVRLLIPQDLAIDIGDVRILKERLDTVFTSSLVLSF